MDFSTKFFLVLRNGPSLPLCLLNLCFHRVFVSVGDSPGLTLAVCILLLLTQREVYFTRGYCLVYTYIYIYIYIYIYTREEIKDFLWSPVLFDS